MSVMANRTVSTLPCATASVSSSSVTIVKVLQSDLQRRGAGRANAGARGDRTSQHEIALARARPSCLRSRWRSGSMPAMSPEPAAREQGSREGNTNPPGPDASLSKLDGRQLGVLRRVGEEWGRVCGNPEVWRRALPLETSDVAFPDAADVRPTRFGRFVAIASTPVRAVEADREAEVPPSQLGQLGYRLRRLLLGPPLKSTAIARERMRKLIALPVLSADTLSSVADGVSYRQTIRAYPHGGGSYIVASDNLGRVPGLVAAAGLMTDYILTVAVSVASGVAAVTSAIPSLRAYTDVIGLAVIVVLLAGNMRGVRQAGALFAAPTYLFILAMFALVAVGLLDSAGHGFQPTPRPPLSATEGVGVLLVLRAFASGSTAMTGIEAISNAVPVFKPTEWRNARTTLTWMVGLLIVLFAGTIAMVLLDGVVPNAHETVLSELAHG